MEALGKPLGSPWEALPYGSPTLWKPYLREALPYGQSSLTALTYLYIKERKNHKE
jgi:hypothetical protein